MALAVALVTLLILTVMGLAIGAMGVENLGQIKKTARNSSLLQAANGGLHELMDRLYQNETYGMGVTDASADGTGTYSTSSVQANYWWTFNTGAGEPYCTNNLDGTSVVTGWNGLRVPPRMALVVVSADQGARPGGNETVMVVALVTNRLPYAVVSDGTIEVNIVSSVVPGEGNVRSNEEGGSPNIHAETVDGTTFSRDGPGSIDLDDVADSGPVKYDVDPVALPNIPIQQIVASYSTAGVSGTHPFGGPAVYQIPGPGPHDMRNRPDGSIEIESGGAWTRIHPLPASVHVEGSIVISGGGTMEVPQGLHLFVNGNFRTNGSLRQDTSPSGGGGGSPLPNDATFFFVTGNMEFRGAEGQNLNMLAGGNIQQNGSSNYRGIVYSQDGTVDFNGSGSVTGSIIARAGVSNPGNTQAQNLDVRYDPSVFDKLDFLGLEVTGPVRTASWWSSAK